MYPAPGMPEPVRAGGPTGPDERSAPIALRPSPEPWPAIVTGSLSRLRAKRGHRTRAARFGGPISIRCILRAEHRCARPRDSTSAPRVARPRLTADFAVPRRSPGAHHADIALGRHQVTYVDRTLRC